VDTEFLKNFRRTTLDYLAEDGRRRLIFVVGGGGPARRYQAAYREAAEGPVSDAAADWIGIAATRLNGELVRGIFADECGEALVTDPSAEGDFTGRVLVAAGWKPGFSSDFDAVLLAQRFGAREVINLSNISKVYTADPNKDSGAMPVERVGWADFLAIIGEDWVPGRNVPFDPVAARRARDLGMRVFVAAGRDLENLAVLLRGGDFTGTVIG
jgi:uridylate kinase